ncbi:MAG: kelch repeat-containing protein [Patescibacteria group bacterium]|jgi:non-specific serine/threonine protein kinase
MKKFFILILIIGAVAGFYYWQVLGSDKFGLWPDPVYELPNYVFAERPVRTEGGYWLLARPMPTARVGLAATQINGRIYAIGGVDRWGQTVKTVEVFDTFTNSWSAAPGLPVPLHRAAAVAQGGLVYVIGGLQGAALKPTDGLYIYDPKTSSWTAGPAIPQLIGGALAIATDDQIHVFGGRNSFGSLGTHFVFDILAGQWSKADDMISVREGMAGDEFGGHIYLAAGRSGSRALNLGTFESFDLAAEQWDALEALPTPRGNLGAAYVKGRLYVFGGEGMSSALDQIEAYDAGRHVWQSVGRLPVPLQGFGTASINDRVYIIGGGRRPGWSVSDLTLVYIP